MQVAGITRRASALFRSRIFRHYLISQNASPCISSHLQPQNVISSGVECGRRSVLLSASFSSASVSVSVGENSVKEISDKMLESVNVKRSAPPNVWLWSMIEKCNNQDDIKLLFDVLQKLRIFRLSNLRIHDNFNSNLCREVTKACIRAGALDFGKRALWMHNVYGLTPTVASANQLLSHAKEKKDVKLMVDVMSLLKKNEIPLQPATADIVFSICCDADNWELISKYAKRFVKAGVKLRKTTFDIWMEFASKRGDLESLWKIEKLRSERYNKHTIVSGFSCTKGVLLEHKPEDAAAIIQDLVQNFPDPKQQDIIAELQILVSVWPSELIKHQKREDQKALITSLKGEIPAMINFLSKVGLVSTVTLEDLDKVEPLSC